MTLDKLFTHATLSPSDMTVMLYD